MRKSSIPYSHTGKFPAVLLDYIADDPKLKSFYRFRPEPEVFAAAIRERNYPASNRSILAEVVISQYKNQAPEFSDKAAQLAKALQQEHTFTVTTGHQLNIFSGPLYSIYKIATTISLANDLNRRYPNNKFIPVFWMASEDHDFEEINHLHIQDQQFTWSPGFPPIACGRMNLQGLEEVIAQLRNATGESNLLEGFDAAVKNSRTLAEATRRWIHFLFADHSLLILDGDDAALKKLFVPEMLSDVFEHHPYTLVSATAAELGKNYKVQVTPREINLFYLGDERRSRIVQETSGRYSVLDTGKSFTAQELETEIKTYPARFSPNVVLRPLFQEKVLPNLAYVGGPGELSYWFEFKAMFQHYNIPFPVLIPRNSFMILDNQVVRKMQKANLTANEIFYDRERIINGLLDSTREIHAAVSKSANDVLLAFGQLSQPVTAIDPTLSGSLEAEKQKALKSLAAFEEKIIRAIKKKEETRIAQVDWILNKLFPSGQLQERHQNILAFAKDTDYINDITAASQPFSGTFDILIQEDASS